MATGSSDSAWQVATDGAGNVYVADMSNHRIQKFTGSGTYLTQWGTAGSGDGQFNLPHGVATDAAGNVYVADASNHRIQKFTSTGVYLTKWGSNGTGDGQFAFPIGVATDAAGNVYVADLFNHRVQKFSNVGAYLTQWGSNGTGNGQFNRPCGIATDAAGNVYVIEQTNHRVQKFTNTGTYLTQWGTNGTGNGQFQVPQGVAINAAGNIYVTDTNNHRVQVFGPPSNAIAGDGAGACISTATPCVAVPVVWDRTRRHAGARLQRDAQLTPNLALCGAQIASGGYLLRRLGRHVVPGHAARRQPVHGRRGHARRHPCGATGDGTLFTLPRHQRRPERHRHDHRAVGDGARLRNNPVIPANPGAVATVTIDQVGPAGGGATWRRLRSRPATARRTARPTIARRASPRRATPR